MTPYNSAYPSCERTYTELRIYSSQIDPDLISQQLGLKPSSFQKKGEKRVSKRTGHQREIKINGWFLSSENQVVSKDIREHLDWLLGHLEVATNRLKELQEWPEITMAINCIWWSVQGQGGPTIWPEQMEKMANMNLECSFDISFFGEDEKPRFTISKKLSLQLQQLLKAVKP